MGSIVSNCNNHNNESISNNINNNENNELDQSHLNNHLSIIDIYRSAATSLNVEYNDLLYNISYFRDANQSDQIFNTNLMNQVQDSTSICDFNKFLKPADFKVLEYVKNSIKIANNEIKELADCLVCKELIGKESKIIKLNCNHIFHDDCLIQWLNYKNNCPCCRKIITE